MGLLSHHLNLLLFLLLCLICWTYQFSGISDRRTRRLLSVLAVVGSLGFVFSAISAEDDSVQKEFARDRIPSVRCVVRSSRCAQRSPQVQACVQLSAFFGNARHVQVADPVVAVSVGVPGPAGGDRSPPFLA